MNSWSVQREQTSIMCTWISIYSIFISSVLCLGNNIFSDFALQDPYIRSPIIIGTQIINNDSYYKCWKQSWYIFFRILWGIESQYEVLLLLTAGLTSESTLLDKITSYFYSFPNTFSVVLKEKHYALLTVLDTEEPRAKLFNRTFIER